MTDIEEDKARHGETISGGKNTPENQIHAE